MIRTLKTLGLALVAIAVMSAVVASAASAESQLTGKATKVTATDKSARFTLASGNYVTCHATYTVGNIDSTVTGEPGVHKTLVLPASKLTITPHYKECHALTKENKELGPVTVTMNGCDFDLTIGNTIETGKYGGEVEITCPKGPPASVIEIHVYQPGTNHGTNICTTTIGEQGGLSGGTATNTASGVKLSGTVTKIKYTRHNILCGGPVEGEATQTIEAEALGTDAEGNPTTISVSD